MLSIFCIPKPFAGHIAIIQRNAINSWRRLDDDVDIVLFGDDPSIRHEAKRLNVRHVENIQTNEYGTPLMNHVFELVTQHARHEIKCYVNADIILTGDLVQAFQRIRLPEFVMTGRRCNVDVTEALDFDLESWEEDLRQLVSESGKIALSWAMDYFLMRGTTAFEGMPAFAVGRPIWDNWFIYNACRRAVPVIDAGTMALAVHQNHGYEHVPNRSGWKWEGPEAEANRALAADMDRVYAPNDATHVLTDWGPLPAEKTRMVDLAETNSRKKMFKSLPVIAQVRSCVHTLRDAGRRLRGKQTPVVSR